MNREEPIGIEAPPTRRRERPGAIARGVPGAKSETPRTQTEDG